ncbi:MAG: PAS domain S-box protein [Ignavibacteria bacterium]
MEHTSKTILLVEDEAILAYMEMRWLTDEGFNVLHALTGEIAVSMVENTDVPINLILMDIDLGSGIDGTQTASMILKKHDIPVLFHSSHTEKEVVDKTEKITSYGYVVKNSGNTVLLASIKMAFKLHKAHHDLKEKEKALTESQARLRRAELVAKTGNWELHINSGIMTTSRGAGNIYGLQGEQFSLAEIQETPLPEYRSVLNEALKNLIENDVPYNIEFKIKQSDTGEIIDIHSKAEYDKENNIVFGIIRDITERKRMDRALRESESALRTLINAMPDIVYFKDGQGRLLIANDFDIKLFQLEGVDYKGKKDSELADYSPFYRETLLRGEDSDEKAWIHGSASRNDETIPTPEGDSRIFDIIKVPAFNEDGTRQGLVVVGRDITDRVKANKALRESEKLFRTTFENATTGICLVSLEGKFIRVNSMFCAFTGYTANELTSMEFIDITYEEDKSASIELLHRLISGDTENSSFEKRYICKDGQIIWAFVSVAIIWNEAKQPQYFVTHIQDITLSKEAADLLRKNEQTLRVILDESIDPIFHFKSDGTYKYVNNAFAKGIGRDVKDIIGKKIWDVFPKKEADMRYAVLQQAFLSGQTKTIDVCVPGADGDRYFITTIVPLHDEKGTVYSILCSSKDITERKKAELIEKALFDISEATHLATDMEALYKRIHEVINSLISVKNLFIALYEEQSNEISFPYFVDEYDSYFPRQKLVKGLTEYILTHGQSLLLNEQQFNELTETGEVELVGTPSAIWVGVPLQVGGKTIGVIVVQDYENEKAYDEETLKFLNYISSQIAQVIERKMSFEQIEKYTKELSQLNQTKDKFFSIIAHDLKNPFHSINASLHLLLDERENFSAEDKSVLLKGALVTSEKASALLENLLLWSRHQMSKLEYHPEVFSLSTLVSQNIELLKGNAGLKNITLQNNIREDINVMADRNMIDTVLRNLLTNAVKFTGTDGKVCIDVRVFEKTIEVSVADNGVGIMPEIMDKLFRIDQSFSTAGTNGEAGTGLGLIICKEFIEKHRGHIKTESSPGGGTKFSFTISKDSA